MPSGLKVSINLTEGQTIPADGYLIIVTPLNGQGTSFQSVAFYIDGVLTETVAPDTTGTAQWFWNPTTSPGTRLTVVVTGTDATTITNIFNVNVAPKIAAPATKQLIVSPTKPTGIRALVQELNATAKRIIRTLPGPVVYGFPYILLLLLGLNLLLLLFQTQRELRAYRTLQQLLAKERTIAESKKTLMELIAHYFRTPLTVLLGGLDMIDASNSASPVARRLQEVARGMQVKIEHLIAELRATGKVIAAEPVAGTAPNATAVWRHPGLFVPFALIGFVMMVFNYLAQHAGGFTVTQVNLGVQLISFAWLALLTYQTFRRLQLRRRDQRELQQIAYEEAETNQARDNLITQSVSVLGDDIKQVDLLAPQLAASPSSKFISKGQADFHDILTKFAAASKLRGAQSQAPYSSVQTGDLLAAAMQGLQAKASEHDTSVQLQGEKVFVAQEPELLAFVLRSLLDNALAYSSDKSPIDVSVAATPSETIITVRDRGVGIPADKMSLLFQPFSKIEGAEVFTHEGMGFSLYLDTLILSYVGGSLTIESEPKKGTLATIRLPYYKNA